MAQKSARKHAQKSPRVPSKRSLTDFMQAKRREGCAVCELPPEIRAQLRGASKRHIRRTDIIEWLASEYGMKITRAAFDSHQSGRHE